MLSSLESLEEKFKQVEEESERRAMAIQEQDQEHWDNQLVYPRRQHYRKRSSVSVSRFGQPLDTYSSSSSTTTSILASVAQKSTFYHSLANPRSTDSIISEYSEHDSHHIEDDQLVTVTQVERIVGRQPFQKTVDAILPRCIHRSRSHSVLSPTHVIIDVSVETDVYQATHTCTDDIYTIIHPTKAGKSRSRASHRLESPANELVNRAKSLARIFGRKRTSVSR